MFFVSRESDDEKKKTMKNQSRIKVSMKGEQRKEIHTRVEMKEKSENWKNKMWSVI